MHILYILHSLPWNETTGTTLVLDNYIKQARRSGLDVSVMVPDSAYKNLENCAYDQSVRIYAYKSQNNWGISGFDIEQIHNQIETPHMEALPDLVHMINWVNFHPSIFPFLKSIGSPILRSVCDFEEFCPFIKPVYFNENADPCHVPLNIIDCLDCISDNSTLHVHQGVYTYKLLMRDLKVYRQNYKESNAPLIKGRNKFVKSIYSHYFDYLIFPSVNFGNYFLSQLKEDVKFSVVPHGIDQSAVMLPRRSVTNPVKIIYTGGDRIVKGWDVMASAIEIIAQKPNANIEIYFVGNTESIPDDYFSNKNIKLIRHPQYNRDDTFKLLSNFDVAVAPAHFESYGLFVRECAASGVVPVVIPALGVDDFVMNEKNGFLVLEPYAQNLADLILRLSNNTQLLTQLKENLLSQPVPTIEEEFATLQDLYAELCSKK